MKTEPVIPDFETLSNFALKSANRHLRKFQIRRPRMDIRFFGGANWMDLTGNCVNQIIRFAEENPKFLKRFRHTLCPDEIFFQTIICNHAKNVQLQKKHLRYIDWTIEPDSPPSRTSPRTLRMCDFEKIKESPAIFARKFDAKIDNEVIEKIYAELAG